MATPKVRIIVLNFQGEQTLLPCVASLQAASDLNDEIVIVDNGREEALMQKVRDSFPKVKIFVSEKNQGFARGMNQGLLLSGRENFDAFWLMNNDAIVAADALVKLKAALSNSSGQALYSPIIRESHSKSIWFAGGEIDFLRMRVRHHREIPRQEIFATNFLTGCALFIPRQSLEKIGFLDERYFLYYEDAEYSWRARKKGVTLRIVPESEVYHSEKSQFNPEKVYWLVRSGVEFFLRESPWYWKMWIFPYLALRRVKNWWDKNVNKAGVAKDVARAYTEASPYA